MNKKELKHIEQGIVSTWLKLQLLNIVIVFSLLTIATIGFYILCMIVKHNAGF